MTDLNQPGPTWSAAPGALTSVTSLPHAAAAASAACAWSSEWMTISRRTYPNLPTSAAASTMRFEKPHSLSYQLITRTKRLSMTLVCVMSKLELWESWLKSVETTSSFTTARMPRKRFDFDAFSISSLTSSLLVSRLAENLKSISETVYVWTP